MKVDSCGFCSTYQLEVEDEIKYTTSPKASKDTIEHVESIVNSETKLESIYEEKEEQQQQQQQKQQQQQQQEREGAPPPVSSPMNNINNHNLTVNTMSVQEITVVHKQQENKSLKENDDEPQRDFDVNPTDLYLALSAKDWNTAIARCHTTKDENNNEARIWIYRKEADGISLRWKLLPIHAAVIFCAPVNVVRALLEAYPAGITAVDDQGMVPLHLAIRMASCEQIVELLANEETVAAKDRKGRTPKHLAERRPSEKKELYLQAMSPQALAAKKASAATPLSSFVLTPPTTPKHYTSPKVVPTNMEEMKQAHLHEIEKLKRESEARSIQLNAKVNVLESELQKTPLLEAAIVDLECKLKEHQEREAEREERLQEVQKEAQDIKKEKETMDEANKAVITNLVSQVGDLQSKLDEVTSAKEEVVAEKTHTEESREQERGRFVKDISILQIKLGDTSACLDETTAELQKTKALNEKHVAKMEQMEKDAAVLRMNLETAETKLDEVTISEQELAWQNSSLAEKLATGGGGGADYRVKALEKERDELRTTVNKLSVKLYKVVGFLDEMVQEQEAIITASMTRESQDISSSGNDDSVGGSMNKGKLRTNVTGMKEQIITVIDSVIDGLPKSSDDVHQAKAPPPTLPPTTDAEAWSEKPPAVEVVAPQKKEPEIIVIEEQEEEKKEETPAEDSVEVIVMEEEEEEKKEETPAEAAAVEAPKDTPVEELA